MKNLSIFLFTFIIICTCCKNNEPSQKPLLTVNIDDNYPRSPNQWMFLSDEGGNVLQISEIPDTPTLLFAVATPDDSLIVTIVRSFSTTGGSHVMMDSYSGILAHGYLNLKAPVGENFSNAETNISVDNYKPSYDTMSLVASDGMHTVILGRGPQNIYYGKLLLLASPLDLLISGYTHDRTPVYFKTGSTSATNINVDFSDFKPFEKTFTLPPIGYMRGTLSGYKDEISPDQTGYQLSQFEFWDTGAVPCKVGYFDGYAGYKTSFEIERSLGDKSYSITYKKKGSLNTSPEFPQLEFEITPSSPAAPVVTAKGDYTYKTCYYSFYDGGGSSIAWSITSPAGRSARFNELPIELTQRFPNLKINNLHYQYANFIHYVDGTTYNSAINNILQGTEPKTYEYYSYVKFNY